MSKLESHTTRCRWVCTLMDDFISGELSVETSREILVHLDECDGCRAEKLGREGLRSALQRAYRRQSVPTSLARRIEAELGPHSAPQRRWGGLIAAALLVLLVGMGGALLFQRNQHNPRDLAEVVQNHWKCQILQDTSSERLPVAPAVLREALLPLPKHYTLISAHFCQFNDRSFVHYVVEGEDRFSIILEARGRAPEAPGEGARRPGDAQPRVVNYQHASVATAQSQGYFIYLVGDERDGDTSLQLLNAVLPALRRSLA